MKPSPKISTHLIKQIARQQQLVNMNNNSTTPQPQRSAFSSVRDGCSLSAHHHQGQRKASLKDVSNMLKDVSNMKKPSNTPTATTKVKGTGEEKVAAGSFNPKYSKTKTTIKLNEGSLRLSYTSWENLRLLNHVASQWSTGKGVCQTPYFMKLIRISLNRGIPRDDLANYVAAGLSDEVQAMELKRAKACVTRIYNSMTTIEKPKKKKTKRGAHMKKMKLLPGQYGY